MNIFIIWFLVILGIGMLRFFLKKRFAIDREEQAGIPVRRFERWSGTVMVSVVILLILFSEKPPEQLFSWILFVFLAVNAGQVFLEWKFLKKSRKYQMSIVYFAVMALALFVFIATVSWQIG